tara:strand:+ start:228 stop:506 length:279 start_codon:yes stop_codon:yes gene_type:complete
MALSNTSIVQIADALVPEVIDYLRKDEESKIQILLGEMVGDAVCRKLGKTNSDGSCSIDGQINRELILTILSRVKLHAVTLEEVSPNDTVGG